MQSVSHTLQNHDSALYYGTKLQDLMTSKNRQRRHTQLSHCTTTWQVDLVWKLHARLSNSDSGLN